MIYVCISKFNFNTKFSLNNFMYNLGRWKTIRSFYEVPFPLSDRDWWLGGSLTGTVSSNRVSEDFKGMFILDGY